ncbi:hypothetical protein E2C01_059214 [Portunus trituberculatus]|uniref:Uncharacterized protein n=1 Tax=Portunus trituberculatus TaxID=210409 RepID=A0A5B7H7Q4_PORTR|nr:hypothetical protein [Portunus trituberculatus]
MGLDSLVQSAVCADFRRMKMHVREETVPLILEDAAKQVENPMTSSDVEGERLELHCPVVREGKVADATVRACGHQAAASSGGREVDGDAGEAIPVLSPLVVDLEVGNSTKLTPDQLEKRLMKHEDVFCRDAQDLGCTSLVQPSNFADSPLMKQSHSREKMRLPLDLTTGRLAEEERPQMTQELVVTLQVRMEATRRQVSNNRHLARQAMTCWYQLRAGDTQYAVGDHGWRYNPYKKRGTTLKRLETYWEHGKAVHPVTYKLDVGTSRWRRIVHVDRLWAAVEEGYFKWGQQGPPSSPNSEVRTDSEVVGDGGIKQCCGNEEKTSVSAVYVSLSDVNSRDDYFVGGGQCYGDVSSVVKTLLTPTAER